MINQRFLRDMIKMLHQHSKEVLEKRGELAFYRWAHVTEELKELLEELKHE